MNEENDVPDWAYERMRGFIANESAFSAFARYIAQHDQPPMDPDEQLVRDIINAFEGNDWIEDPKIIDGHRESLDRAIKLYKEINQ